jgi:hypothetical protein
MFNVPLITGNEIPYSITLNRTLLNQVYSFYYTIPDINDTLDVINQTSKIITWQSDKAILTNEFLQIDFNSTYQIDKWHQVELKLPFANTWSNFTHMIVQFTAELSLDRLQIGIGDTEGYGGCWSGQNHVYQVNNETFIPTETATLVTRDNGTITLLVNLEKPDLSNYSINNVTSIWIQYFMTSNSDIPRISINKMLVANLSLNTIYYAELLAYNNIKYLLVDLAIKDGAKNDPKLWLNMLSNSNYFRLIWQKDTLYIFENIIY